MAPRVSRSICCVCGNSKGRSPGVKLHLFPKDVRRMMLVVTVVAAALAVAAAEQPTVEVTLKQGTILGSREETRNGHFYYSFRSIPYAKPPVGHLRFKDPQPAPAWSGVKNGSLPIPKCPQPNFLAPEKVTGQEDCLYLNVYTPKPYSSDLPVMVYIHGGAFIMGSAEDTASPEPLIQKDVVVVALNYRLGVLGFLSTEDDVLPGNMGLKDQTLALRWVQANIKDLGGDPQLVTIFGVSAGGISAHLHIFSPSSAGLFQRAILQSGTALLPGTFPASRVTAINISKGLNCTSEESQHLLACFTAAAVNDLVKLQRTVSEWSDLAIVVGPRVDGTYMPQHPAALLKVGRYNKVDVMSGATQDDGNIVTTVLFGKVGKKKLQELNNNFTKVTPIILSLMDEENPVYLARRVFFNYMTDLNVTRDDEFALMRIFGDLYFNVPNSQVVEFHAKDPNTKTFMYRFDHRPEISALSVFLNSTQERKMAGHGDDMMFLFQFPPPLGPLSRPQDLHMQDILVNLWTNFASTGNPTINGTLGFRWTPVAPKGPLKYLSLSTTPTMQPVDSLNSDFWNSLPTKITKLLYPELFLQDTSP